MSDGTSSSFYQLLPGSNRRTQGYQPPSLQTPIQETIGSTQLQGYFKGRNNRGHSDHRSSNQLTDKDPAVTSSQDARNYYDQPGMKGRSHPSKKQTTEISHPTVENTKSLHSGALKENRAMANAAISNREQDAGLNQNVRANKRSPDHSGLHERFAIANTSPSPSKLVEASKAGLVSPIICPWRRVPDRSSLLPPAGPDDVVPSGNWDCSDAWTSPGLFNVPADYETSRDDIDFTTRPVSGLKIRVAQTARDVTGKQAVQRAINPDDKAEYPTLTTSVTKKLTSKQAVSGTLALAEEEKSARLPPHKRIQVKVPPPAESTPIKDPVKAEQSGDNLKVRSDEINSMRGSSLPAQRIKEPYILPHLRVPKPVHAGGPVEDKSPQPVAVVLPPHLRQPQKSADHRAVEAKPSTQTHKGDSFTVPAHTLSAQAQSGNTSSRLVTKASSFLSQTAQLSDQFTHRMQLANSVTLATTAPTVEASPKVPDSDVGSLGDSQQPGMVPISRSSMPNHNIQIALVKQQDAHDDTFEENYVTGLQVRMPSASEPAEQSFSNASVRGKDDENISQLAVSLTFDDAFKGSNPSDIYPKVPDDGENPYRKNEYENSLRGWDGDWGPAPIEWDRRGMYDLNKPEHKEYVQNFVKDRIGAYEAGLCPPVVIDDEDFTLGRSLAIGGLKFDKPIHVSEHHHIRDTDPFTLHHIHGTAKMAIDNWLRVTKKQQEKEEAEEARKLSKVERKARKQVASEKAVMEVVPPNPYQPKSNIYVRPARVKDLPQIRDIFNHYITTTTAVTGERYEVSDRGWRDRFDNAITEKYPFIVAVIRHQQSRKFGGEKVVGFTYAEDFEGEQSMWRHTCELQFYVDHDYVKMGVGKNLVDCIMRGLNSLYRPKGAVDFVLHDSETPRHEDGGERLLSHVLVPYAYLADQVEQRKWVGEWLIREFGFKLKGTLDGIGRIGNPGKAVNLAYYVLETSLM
ncbi:MAG: hypothetical protein Q9218_005690 [Villophora microphyllina]